MTSSLAKSEQIIDAHF